MTNFLKSIFFTAIVGICLGLLAGIAAAYMNFKLGFFLGGSMLAGVIGSSIVLVKGKEGLHDANYIQTLASAMGSMAGLTTIQQAMYWMDIPQPPIWQMMLFLLITSLFSIGVGVGYTPLLVDQWKLAFPSGKAVANNLRALTDVRLLKKSMTRLFGSMFVGFAGGKGWILFPSAWSFSAATLGAGMIVGARIAIPGMLNLTHQGTCKERLGMLLWFHILGVPKCDG